MMTMKVPSKAELLHFRMQAAIRENVFDETQFHYLGERNGQYWYFIGGYEVSSDQLDEFEVVDE